MRFVGIDIASETHVVAALSEDGTVLLKPTSILEDAAGYEKLWTLLGKPVCSQRFIKLLTDYSPQPPATDFHAVPGSQRGPAARVANGF